MPKIGVVLAGAASKGAYEIGCLRAIEDKFGLDSIKCITSASMATVIAQSYGNTRAAALEKHWKELDIERFGRHFLAYAKNPELMEMVYALLLDGPQLPYAHYASIWNFTKSKLEYIPFHTLSGEQLQAYIHGGCSVPFVTKGVSIDGKRIFDGAFLDNIPIMPLMEMDLDYIFCVYFDNYRYTFETKEFDRKVIKLFDFPNVHGMELLYFTKENFDGIVQYGYDYTTRVINEVFVSEDPEEVYAANEQREATLDVENATRFTADVVLHNINDVTKWYARRSSRRKREKIVEKEKTEV